MRSSLDPIWTLQHQFWSAEGGELKSICFTIWAGRSFDQEPETFKVQPCEAMVTIEIVAASKVIVCACLVVSHLQADFEAFRLGRAV